jgi:prepilin-type N-terminal cleavage/methylation domain-containing protein
MPRTTKRSARRAGFTMVEMLVVITIIAILISLTAAAVIKLIPAQQALNTKTELTRLQGDLVRAYRSAADKFRKEPIPTGGAMLAAYNAVYNMAGQDRSRAQVIWTKLRLKQTFPNNFSEALNPAPTLIGVPNIALSYYQTKLGAVGYTAANTVDNPPGLPYQPQPWESSVCLLLALQRGEDGPALQESDIGTGSLKDFGQTPPLAKDPSSGFTPLPNHPPIKGLVDNWGTPLAFCRWPVYSLVLNPAPPNTPNPPAPPAPPGVYYPQPGDNNDSDDPSGLLESSTWQATAGFGQFQNLCHPLVPHPPTNPPTRAQTYRITPLIVSAGPDRRLGLDKEPVGFGPVFALTAQPAQYFFGVQSGLPGAPGSLSNDNIYPTLASPK